MQSFRLLFADDGIGVARRVEFEAEDAARAIAFARSEARNRSAELWLENRPLCTISRAEPQPCAMVVQAAAA